MTKQSTRPKTPRNKQTILSKHYNRRFDIIEVSWLTDRLLAVQVTSSPGDPANPWNTTQVSSSDNVPVAEHA